MSAERLTFEEITEMASGLLMRFEVLSGNIMDDSGKTSQDHARIAAEQCRMLANMLDQAADGNTESFFTYPSFAEILDETGM